MRRMAVWVSSGKKAKVVDWRWVRGILRERLDAALCTDVLVMFLGKKRGGGGGGAGVYEKQGGR